MTAIGWGPTGQLQYFDFTQVLLGADAGFLASLGLSLTRSTVGTVQVAPNRVDGTPGINVARYGYDGFTRGLVIDESRTELVKNSNALNNASYFAGTVAATPNNLIGPDGVDTASESAVASGGYSRNWFRALNITGAFTASAWLRMASGVGTYNLTNAYGLAAGQGQGATGVLTTDWQRATATASYIAQQPSVIPIDGRNTGTLGGGAASARDQFSSFIGFQAGAFPVEAILTGNATLTTGGDRLFKAAGNTLLSNGALRLEYIFAPKGASFEYSADAYFWASGADFLKFNATTQQLQSSVGGVLWTAPTMAWNRGDTIDLFAPSGNGASRALYRVKPQGGVWGAVQDLGIGPVQPALAIPGALDLMGNAAANQMSARLLALGVWS